MEDPKEIARKLTKAQRGLIAATPPGCWVDNGFYTDRVIASGGAVATSLVTKGLMHRKRTFKGRPRDIYQLSLAGLAVREALLTPTREDQSYD